MNIFIYVLKNEILHKMRRVRHIFIILNVQTYCLTLFGSYSFLFNQNSYHTLTHVTSHLGVHNNFSIAKYLKPFSKKCKMYENIRMFNKINY